MARSNGNPKRYRLAVTKVTAVPSPGLESPEIILEFDGALSIRAKRAMRDAIREGRVVLSERRLA